MQITRGTNNDLNKYTEIYLKYIKTVYSNGSFTDELVNKVLQFTLSSNKLQRELESSLCRVYFLKDEDMILGFIQANIVDSDDMFELPHVYISNLFIDTDVIRGDESLKYLLEMYKRILKWAMALNIKYICDDINADNKIMKTINRALGFREYRIRYYMELKKK